MKKMVRFLLVLTGSMVLLSGCNAGLVEKKANNRVDVIASGEAPADIAAWEAEVDENFRLVLESLGTEDELYALSNFDEMYGTNWKDNLGSYSAARSGSSGKSGSSKYPSLTDMPFKLDGAVYISGGTDDLVGTVIDWVSPKTFPGSYYHGAVLDYDKYDPNNEDVYCLETAISKGAGYETADQWRHKVNACVLNPTFTVNKTKLDAAQLYMDRYCDMNDKSTEYGFFKNTINIFDIVTKEDMKTWYCTKVVWWVYHKYGIDIDSNSTKVDFTTSGLYTLVKDYYAVRYFYSSSKKNAAINEYLATARKDIVLAEEIMLSPYFKKVYERIREN